MPEYRIYTLDIRGNTLSSVNLNCRDDEDACALARGMLTPNPPLAEIWSGTRCVGRVSILGSSGANAGNELDGPPVYRSGKHIAPNSDTPPRESLVDAVHAASDALSPFDEKAELLAKPPASSP